MNTPRRGLCPTPFGILATLIDSRAFGKLPDLTNKFVLEHQLQQGEKAGLTRSVGFSVLEGNRLIGFLEFSSETATQLDGTLVSAICDIGVQLGRVFEREGAARKIERMQRQDEEHRGATKKLRACTVRYGPPLQASLERLRNQKLTGGRASARQMASSLKLMQRCLNEMRQISARRRLSLDRARGPVES
jgi:hypothetical protein